MNGGASPRWPALDLACAVEAVLGGVAVAQIPEDMPQGAQVRGDDRVVTSPRSRVDRQRTLTEDARLRERACVLQHPAEVTETAGDRGVMRTVALLVDGHRALEALAGAVEIPAPAQRTAEDLQVDSHLGVHAAERRLVEGERPLDECSSGVVQPEVVKDTAEMAEDDGDLRMLRTEAYDGDAVIALQIGARRVQILDVAQQPAGLDRQEVPVDHGLPFHQPAPRC